VESITQPLALRASVCVDVLSDLSHQDFLRWARESGFGELAQLLL